MKTRRKINVQVLQGEKSIYKFHEDKELTCNKF